MSCNLRQELSYDPETGKLAWLNPAKRRKAEVGSVDRRGYRRLCVGKDFYLAHRVAWTLFHGKPPEHQIDHINGDRDDNRIANLRDVPPEVNAQNIRRAHRDSASGWLGVRCRRAKFIAEIMLDGKLKQLGAYETPEFAHGKYLSVKRSRHAGCTI